MSSHPYAVGIVPSSEYVNNATLTLWILHNLAVDYFCCMELYLCSMKLELTQALSTADQRDADVLLINLSCMSPKALPPLI